MATRSLRRLTILKKHTAPFWPLLLLLWSPIQAQPQGYQDLVNVYQEIRALDLGRIDNLEEGTFVARGEAVRNLRPKLEAIDTSDWSVSARIDRMLVGSALCQLEFEHAVTRPWRTDPGFYVDRLAPLAYTKLPRKGAELEHLKEGLSGIPLMLASARLNLTEGAATLTALALRNLEKADGVGHGQPYRDIPPAGVIGWYQDLLARAESSQPDLAPVIRTALEAIQEFHGWLKEKQPEMNRPSGVGQENYSWYLKNVRLMPFSIDELRIIGDRELQRALAQLQLERARNRGLPELEPASSETDYKSRIEAADRALLALLRDKQVLTIPDGIGPFDHNVPWVVRPGGRNFWEEIQYRDPLPDDVHAVMPGHRFDAALHERDNRPIRGGFHDSGRVEGWGFYLEESLMRLGLLEDRPRTRELFAIFQAARAIRNQAEIGLQTNTLTLDQAVDLMVSEIPYMDRDVARVDCEIYLRNPGYGVSYLMGKVQIERLLAERSLQLKDQFNLKDFHDKFLASGWIPISLIRWEMTGLTNEIVRLTR